MRLLEITLAGGLGGVSYNLETEKKAAYNQGACDLSDRSDVPGLCYRLTWAAFSVMT